MLSSKRRAKNLIVIGGVSLLLCFYGLNALAANTAPTVGSITPATGASVPNQAVTFTTTYTDPDGWQNIQYVYFLINTSLSNSRCFYAYYNQNTNKLYLRNDYNTAWLGGYAPGSANIIENSYCKLDCSKATVTGSGASMTVTWNVTFKPAFAGLALKKSYLYVKDDSNAYNGWLQKGTWTVDNSPSIGTIAPASGSTKPNQQVIFTATYTDPDGWQNLMYGFLLINASISGQGGFYAYYDQNTQKLYLINDAGTAWQGGFTPGSSNNVENSYVKLDCSKTTVSGSTNTMTVKWAITFKPTVGGIKNMYLYARDDSSISTSWANKGDYDILREPIATPN